MEAGVPGLLKQKQLKQQAERDIDIIKSQWNGMVSEGDKPSSSLPIAYSSKKVNLIDFGTYSEGRSGNRLYNGTSLPAGALGAKPFAHSKLDYIVWIIGGGLYVSDKAMTSFEEVPTDVYGFVFGDDNTIKCWNEEVYIFSNEYLFKLFLTNAPKRCIQINPDIPRVVCTALTDPRSPAVVKTYEYNYLYTFVRINTDDTDGQTKLRGTGNRFSEGAFVEWETGTVQDATERDYVGISSFNEVGLNEYGVAEARYNYPVVNSLSCPCAKAPVHATHYGIYRTKNISTTSSPPGVDPVNGVGNNGQLFVWVTDVPIMRVLTGFLNPIVAGETTLDGILDTSFDIGATIYWEGGSGVVDRINSGGNYYYLKDVVGTVPTNMAFLIGAGAVVGNVPYGSQSGYILTITRGRPFHQSDIGKPIFYETGEIVFIREVISTTQVRVDRSINDVGRYFAYSQKNGTEASESYYTRTFCDLIPDAGVGYDGTVIAGFGLQSKIESGKDFYYPRRFFTSIPCGEIGLIDGGYLLTADRDGMTISYSQIADRLYSMGYHRYDIQKQEVDATIRTIESINGVVSIIMQARTKGMSLKVSTEVGNSDLGESIKKLNQAYMISENVGVYAFGSIAYKGSNQIIALTNEFAIRYFDGASWSAKDLASDAIKTLIRKLDPSQLVVATYSPEGGYKIWGKKWVEDSNSAGRTTEDVCYRLATDSSQGIGWSIFEGEWVWPETPYDAFNILDTNSITRSLVREIYDGDIYEIDTCNRTSERELPYTDKEGAASEAEIETEDWLPEIMVPNNANRSQLKHEVSHDSLRPQRWENRGEAGYTITGMRDLQELSLDVYVDGEKTTPEAYSDNYPETADISFKGVEVTGERVQFVHKSATSEFRRVSVHHKLLVMPQVADRAGREDDESDYQDELFTDKVLHITRNRVLFYDRISKEILAGSGIGITGPDSKSKSAMLLTANLNLGDFEEDNYTILLWIKAGVTVPVFGALTQVGATVSSWMLKYAKVTLSTLTDLTVTSGSVFDIRLYNKHLTVAAMNDYYTNVTRDEGRAYLPGF